MSEARLLIVNEMERQSQAMHCTGHSFAFGNRVNSLNDGTAVKRCQLTAPILNELR
jgi:hypothetical protein